MFMRHTKIVLLLLLYCIAVQSYTVLYNAGSTQLNKFKKTATDTENLHLPQTKKSSARSRERLLASMLETNDVLKLKNQSPMPAEKSDNGSKGRDTNTTSDVLQRKAWRNYVRVAQGEISRAAKKRNQLLRQEVNPSSLDDLGNLTPNYINISKVPDDYEILKSETSTELNVDNATSIPTEFSDSSTVFPIEIILSDNYNKTVENNSAPETQNITHVFTESFDHSSISPIATSTDNYPQTTENYSAPEIHNASNDKADNDTSSTETVDRNEFENKMFKLNITVKQHNKVKIDSGYSRVVYSSHNKTLVT